MTRQLSLRWASAALLLLALPLSNTMAQNVGVDVPAPLQKLDVAGGIRIGNTANGLAGSIRWTGTQFEGHNGTSWQPLMMGGSNSFWSTSGNGGTVASTHFIGTTDNVDLRVRTNNSDRLTVSASGNVGIGTTGPGAPLHVSANSPTSQVLVSPLATSGQDGAITIRGARNASTVADQAQLRFQNFDLDLGTSGSLGTIAGRVTDHAANTGDLVFYSSPNGSSLSETMRITKGGNIGIGTSAPAQKLHLLGNIRMVDGNEAAGRVLVSDANGTGTWTAPSSIGADVTTASNGLTEVGNDIQLGGPLTASTTITQDDDEVLTIANNGTGNTVINLQSTGDFDVQDNGTSAFFVRDDGYVGIGTNSPRWPVTVLNANNAFSSVDVVDPNLYALTLSRPSGSNDEAIGLGLGSSTSGLHAGAGLVFKKTGNNSLGDLMLTVKQDGVSFGPHFPALTIKSVSGNVGVGTTSPTAKLDVVNGNLMVRNTGSTGSSAMTIAGRRGGGATPYNTVNATAPARIDFQNNDVNSSGTDYLAGRIESVNRPGINDGELRFYTTSDQVMQEAMNISSTGNVGIGTLASEKLHVVGNIRMVDGNQAAGRVLVSDVNGTGTWTAATSLTVTETDPQVSSSTANILPKWNGTTLVDGTVFDNGNIGIGNSSPQEKLHVTGRLRMADGTQGAGKVMVSDANGSASWAAASTIVPNMIADADGNTRIRTEANPNEDIIRFGVAGSELYTMRRLAAGSPYLRVHSANTLMGDNMSTAITGAYNTAYGFQTAGALTSGAKNTYVGDNAGGQNTTGSYNTMVGSVAGQFNNGGNDNTFIGADAGRNNLSGSGNVFLGSLAGANETGSNKLYIDNSNTATPLIHGDFATDVLTVNGNLGISTAAPAEKLHIAGRLRMADGTQGAGKVMVSDANGSASWADATSLTVTETDPQVSSATANVLPKWNGTTLVDGTVFDNGNIGIGNSSPQEKLHVTGKLRMVDGTQGAGKVMVSDANGSASWADATSLTVTETDPQVSSSTTNMVPKWNGTTLVDGSIFDNGSVGIGTGSPSAPLHISVNNASAQVLITPSSTTGQDAAIAIRGARNGSTVSNHAQLRFENYDLDLATSNTLGSIVGRVSNHTTNIGDLAFNNSSDGTTLSETMRLTSGGNVGIGAPSPQEKLHVAGKIRMADGTQGAGKMMVSDANGSASWSQGTQNVAYAKNTGSYAHDNSNSYDAITGTASINVYSGDIITITASASVRLTGGSGVDDFFFRTSYTGCASGNNNETRYTPSEDSNDHNNFVPVSYLDVLVAPCTGTLNFQFNAANTGDDAWEAEDRVLVVRRN